MPYLDFYLNNIDCQKNDVSVVYWNRDGKNDSEKRADITYYAFERKQDNHVSGVRKIGKLLNFIRYRRFAKKLLRHNGYDLVITLHSMPAVLLYRVLKRHTYIFDYRDATYEHLSWFRRRIQALVHHSVATFVSSPGYLRFMPADCPKKIYLSHNMPQDRLSVLPHQKSDTVRIAYWGIIRDAATNRQVLRAIAGDRRFELHYYGQGEIVEQIIREEAEQLNAENVFFHGEYAPTQRTQFAAQSDIIHNMFGDDNMCIAMSNRFYDGLCFGVPLLCMKGSVMGEKAEKYGVGIALDPSDKAFADRLYEYVKRYDHRRFEEGCHTLLEQIGREVATAVTALHRLTDSEGSA